MQLDASVPTCRANNLQPGARVLSLGVVPSSMFWRAAFSGNSAMQCCRSGKDVLAKHKHLFCSWAGGSVRACARTCMYAGLVLISTCLLMRGVPSQWHKPVWLLFHVLFHCLHVCQPRLSPRALIASGAAVFDLKTFRCRALWWLAGSQQGSQACLKISRSVQYFHAIATSAPECPSVCNSQMW